MSLYSLVSGKSAEVMSWRGNGPQNELCRFHFKGPINLQDRLAHISPTTCPGHGVLPQRAVGLHL